jgi:hypothetical protein
MDALCQGPQKPNSATIAKV